MVEVSGPRGRPNRRLIDGVKSDGEQSSCQMVEGELLWRDRIKFRAIVDAEAQE